MKTLFLLLLSYFNLECQNSIYRQSDSINLILRNSSFEKLIYYIDSSDNKYIKCEAFLELIHKHKKVDFYTIIKKSLSDTNNVFFPRGCFRPIDCSVSDYFMGLFDTINFPENSNLLTSYQRKELDSLILFTPLVGEKSLSRVISCLDYTKETNCKRVRYLATEMNNFQAFYSLSKLQRKEDLAIFKSLLNSEIEYKKIIGLKCANHYLNNELKEILIKMYKDENNGKILKYYYLDALSKYNDERIKSIFNKIITDEIKNERSYDLFQLKIVIDKNKYYEDIFNKIQLRDSNTYYFVESINSLIDCGKSPF